ncbi:MAG: DUF2497 domain-containing protein [Dichotomicrobium sp.]
MSAESKQSQPSIDDILSSIREIIADDSVETGHAERRDTPDRTDVAQDPGGQNGAAGSDEDEGPAAVEDVLDLSEEFIVTEAAAAVRREQEQQAQADAEHDFAGDETLEAGTDDGVGDIEPETSDESAVSPADDDMQMTQADIWAQDFQMPVADDGPASPFTATQTNPESVWPSGEPFDVTDSYKLARSLGTGARAIREQPRATEPDAAPQETAQAEPDNEEAPETVEEDNQDGIELTSFSEPADEADRAASPEQSEAPDEPEQDSPEAAAEPQARRFHAAEEIEAVFGMPPRGWAGPSMPGSTQAEESADEDTQTAEAEAMAEDEMDHDDHAAAAYPEHDADDGGAGQSETTWTEPADNAPDIAPARHVPPDQTPLHEPPPDPIAQSAAATGTKSLEESVKELLRPMLAEWLDKNMPRLVEAAMREQMTASQEAESDEAGPDRDPAAQDDRDDL